MSVDNHRFLFSENVSRETHEKLALFVSLLVKWQKTLNLVSNNDLNRIWERHISDSWQLVPLVQELTPRSIVDLGSGGGFPGVILAIAYDCPIYLVESDERKGAFLETVCAELELFHVKLMRQRIEHVSIDIKPHIVTARGCASIKQMLIWSTHFLSPHSICVFPKGKNYATELKEATQAFGFEHKCQPSLTESGAQIIQLWNIHSHEES